MVDLKTLTANLCTALRTLGRHSRPIIATAWRASARGPWRPALVVLLGFALPLLALAATPARAGAEQWQRIESLAASGAVRQLLAGRRDAEVYLYAVVDGWGVYRSTDGGCNWLPVDRHLPRGRWGHALLGPLALAHDDPALLLAAIDGPAAGGPSIYRSTDGGRTWLPRRGLGVHDVHALAVAPDRLVYAATQDRLYRSADGGNTWLEAGRRPAASPVLSMLVDLASGTLYIGSAQAGLWRTGDRGASWWAALDEHSVYAIGLGAEGRVYAATDEGLHASLDNGISWHALGTSRDPIVALAVVPGSPDRILAATPQGPLQYSPDGGATWQSLSHTLLQSPVTALAVDPISTRQVYVGTERGLWRCTLPAEVQHEQDDD